MSSKTNGQVLVENYEVGKAQYVYLEKAGNVTKTFVHFKKRYYCSKLPVVSKEYIDLLSQGWKVIPPPSLGEQKKGTDEVREATSKTSTQFHGGDHSSGEVKKPKNGGKYSSRGKRGTSKGAVNKPSSSGRSKSSRMHNAGGSGTYVPADPKATKKLGDSAREAASILKGLIGFSTSKSHELSGTRVDLQGLLLALEIGDNPIPHLESPKEAKTVRCLVTPDCSGSTADWSRLSMGFARILAELEDVDVHYLPNFNGRLKEDELGDEDTKLEDFDVLIYLGDNDGKDLLRSHARHLSSNGYCIGLSNVSCRVGIPRIVERGDNFLWIERVTPKEPQSIVTALKKVFG